MSEADYMDDCQRTGQWDEENAAVLTHEVVCGSRIVFQGSRAACWKFKRLNGGFVQKADDHD